MPQGEAVYPYDTVVYITDTIDGVGYQASGVLIAPSEVLTASHVVYSSQYGTATNITVTPGYDLGQSPYGSVAGTSFHYNAIQDPNGSITTQQSQYDYALIHLAQPFASAGTMGLDTNFYRGSASVTGYPASAGGAQVTAPDYMTLYYPYSVYIGTALGPGSSGGPVWTYGSNGQADVVGLVSSGNPYTGTGYFTRITSSAYNTIESWIAQDAAACFVEGTRIATARGEIPVEDLAIGDEALTHFAGRAAIAWIGHRRLDGRRHPRPQDVWPIRVRADAFAPGRPRRDLFLSPDHAVFAGGVLIPVRYLLNGATIVQEPRDTVTYWHVELPRHDILCAEGLPAESFLDTGNRASFANGGPAVVLHPDLALRIWDRAACAPLLRDGPLLAAIRRRLQARVRAAGYRLTRRPDLRVCAGAQELPVAHDGRRWGVAVPPGTASLRLVSRTWVPAHATPAESDARRLGVAVARIWIDGRAASLDSAALARGWHAPERGWRWTDGNAELALAGIRRVAFELAMTGAYWVRATPACASFSPARPAAARGTAR